MDKIPLPNLLDERLDKLLCERRESGLYRVLRDYRDKVDFCSNDYLGLATDTRIFRTILDCLDRYKERAAGASGSRLISGNTDSSIRFEEYFASLHTAESALLFTSGFAANIALFSSLPQKGDTVLYDAAIHASVRDGLRLSRARSYSFRHNDLEHLEALLNSSQGHVFIAVEALYSMDGDLAPVSALNQLAERFGATLIVDEAHSAGVYGPSGRGLCAEHLTLNPSLIRVFAFGKAYGCQGAVILSSQRVRDYLVNFARPFIYTTGVSPLLSESLLVLTEEVAKADERRQKLFDRIAYFKEVIDDEALVSKAISPIIPLIFPGILRVKELAARLLEDGYAVTPILSPTVPAGLERLRVSIHAHHSQSDIQGLADRIREHSRSASAW